MENFLTMRVTFYGSGCEVKVMMMMTTMMMMMMMIMCVCVCVMSQAACGTYRLLAAVK